ncbi:MAG: hypothetical protein IIC18_01670 [Bacteroidetes bacterium]|nr:hypothetical protein [Bacteroidota bacterium]MCH8031949.1 hypothetical protein [Bacteroidota bacterium]
MFRFVLLIGLASSVSACGPSGTSVSFGNLCVVENSDQVMVSEGYLNAGDHDIPCRESAGSLECMLEFAAMPEDTSFVSAYVRSGDGPNQVSPPAVPGSPFLLRAHDGEPLNANEHVRLTGLVYVQNATDSTEAVCAFREVISIERVEG